MSKSDRYRAATFTCAVTAAWACLTSLITISPSRAEADQRDYQLAEIFLPFHSPGDEEAVRKQAEAAIYEVRAVRNFAAVARKVSKAPSAQTNGDIGWQSAQRLSPAFRNALRRTRAGNMTEPIRTAAGFYVLLVRDVRGPMPTSDWVPETTLPAGQIELVQVDVAIYSDTPKGKSAALSIAQHLRDEITACGSAFHTAGTIARVGNPRVVAVATLPDELQLVLPGLRNDSPGPVGHWRPGFASFFIVCDGGLGPAD